MTKEITKAFIIQEIQDKFRLRELVPETFAFAETVVPIYNIEPHIQTRKVDFEEVSITTTGGFSFFTVPQNERWTLQRYDVIFMGAGAITVSGVYVTRQAASAPFIYLDLEAGQTISYHTDLGLPIGLDPGNRIRVNIDGYTSTQNLRLYIDYVKEEIR